MEEEKGKTNRKDTENNADENKTQSSSDQASSDQLSNEEEGATVEKKGKGQTKEGYNHRKERKDYADCNRLKHYRG